MGTPDQSTSATPLPPPLQRSLRKARDEKTVPDAEGIGSDDLDNDCDFSIAHDWLNRLNQAQLDGLKFDLQQMAGKFGLSKAVLVDHGQLKRIELTSSDHENLFRAHEELCNPDGMLAFYHLQLSDHDAHTQKVEKPEEAREARSQKILRRERPTR